MSSKLVNSLAKAYELQSAPHSSCFDLIQIRIESLSDKMDQLITIQEKVLNRLDGMSQDINGIEKDMETMKVDKEEIHLPPRVQPKSAQLKNTTAGGEVREICQEMSSIMSAVNQRSELQERKLEGMEKLVLSIQQVISFIGETVKSSRVMELVVKGPAARKAGAASAIKSKESRPKGSVKRQASADKSDASSTKRVEKTTTSATKAPNGPQEVVPACEAKTPEPAHKTKLHGPKHFLASRKCRKPKGTEGKEKSRLSLKSLKSQKKPPDNTADPINPRKQALLLDEVQKLNRQNAEKSGHRCSPGLLDLEAGSLSREEPQGQPSPNPLNFVLKASKAPVVQEEEVSEVENKLEDGLKEEVVSDPRPKAGSVKTEQSGVAVDARDEKEKEADAATSKEASAANTTNETSPAAWDAVGKPESTPESGEEHKSPSLPSETPLDQMAEANSSSKRGVTEEELGEEQKKSRGEGGGEEEEEQKNPECEVWDIFKGEGLELQMALRQLKEKQERLEKEKKEGKDTSEVEEEDVDPEEIEVNKYFIDGTPPAAAPFEHRIVTAKPNLITNFYSINRQEILGGGRFGQVHKCIENSSGLTLAAKIIKGRSQKEKDVVKNEIMVMNQLDHANLIQLYAAYESRNDIILVLEYVDGGELFDRIIDENYTLTELDTVTFIRQICAGLQHMHKMYILHLDLKPENILCVSRVTNKIKIIDFGLARKYKPREKLKVNFGTPEFLAPEVINYDFVSFNTDMWSLGVITYMLLSGLSPFLGDDDNETLNNILACQWNFEEDEFTGISEDAKDFISKLLIVNKSWRIGASEALKHSWLSDAALHHRLHEKRNMCRSRRNSCVPSIDS